MSLKIPGIAWSDCLLRNIRPAGSHSRDSDHFIIITSTGYFQGKIYSFSPIWTMKFILSIDGKLLTTEGFFFRGCHKDLSQTSFQVLSCVDKAKGACPDPCPQKSFLPAAFSSGTVGLRLRST